MIAARQIAFGKAAGAAKPYKARLEYLESTGTQYIDTGIHPSSRIDMSCTFALTTINNYRHVMGNSSYRASDAVYGIYLHGVDIPPYVYIGKGKWRKKIEFSFVVGEKYTSTLEGSTATLSSNGQVLLSDAMSNQNYEWEYTDSHIKLFTAKAASVYSKVYSAWIDEGGVRVRSLIPVLDNNDVVCMYDEVSGEFFYNQGEGEFIAGSEITEE